MVIITARKQENNIERIYRRRASRTIRRSNNIAYILKLLDDIYISDNPHYNRYPKELDEILPKDPYESSILSRIEDLLRQFGSVVKEVIFSMDKDYTDYDNDLLYDIYRVHIPFDGDKYVMIEWNTEGNIDYTHIKVFNSLQDALRYIMSRISARIKKYSYPIS